VVDGTGPVELTLTVVGGRESGKTVLLAGAFYEWSTQNLGNLRITPAAAGAIDPLGAVTGGGNPVVSLDDVARELYINYQFRSEPFPARACRLTCRSGRIRSPGLAFLTTLVALLQAASRIPV
jgi:hypothetical protein